MSKNDKKVINRAASSVGYVAYTGQNRRFEAHGQRGDTLLVPEEELVQLSYTRGGALLLERCLMIEDEKLATKILGDEPEQEYYFTRADVEKTLTEASLEDLEESLEYAPQGTRELFIQVAIETKLDSNAKREIIKKVTGFNLDRAIDLAVTPEQTQEQPAEKPARRQRKKATSAK